MLCCLKYILLSVLVSLVKKVGDFRLGNVETLLNNSIRMIFFLGWNFTKEDRLCSQLEYHTHSFLLDILNHVTFLSFQLGREEQGPTLAEKAELI